MTDAPFRPFETHLDEAAALAILRAATAGAEDGELFLERRRSEALVLDDGRIKTASYDASEGFGLRAVRARSQATPIPPKSPNAPCAARPKPRGWPWAMAAAPWPPRRKGTNRRFTPTPTRWPMPPLP
jgi:hypothetical protein